jgi:hypothetical protein
MLMDHIPRCPFSRYYVIRLHDRISHVVEEIINEVGAVEGRDLRQKVHRILPRASRDRPGDDVWLDFAAPHIQALGCGCYGH